VREAALIPLSSTSFIPRPPQKKLMVKNPQPKLNQTQRRKKTETFYDQKHSSDFIALIQVRSGVQVEAFKLNDFLFLLL
jgi:hypothetical protein